MVQSKLDLISYDKLFNEANKFTIKQLIKQNNAKKVKVLQSLHFDPNLNASQMNVSTPFYSRSSCPSKGPCHCPYHRMKNVKISVPFSKAHRKIKIDKNANEKYRKTITQQNYINGDNKNINTLEKNIQSNRKSETLEQDKYANISHKVQCKNEEFQLFLKKNALYILSRKSNKKQSTTQSDLVQNFIDKFNIDLFNLQKQKYPKGSNMIKIDLFNPHKQKYPKGSNMKQMGRRRHASIQNAYNINKNINRFSEQNFINKIRNIVNLILKREKHLDLDSMRKFQLIFGRLVQQKKQIHGQTDQYFKDKISLEQFHDFINVFIENQRIKALSNKRQSQKQLKQNNSQRSSISSLRSQISNNNDSLKQKMRESSRLYRKGPYNNNQVHILRKKDRKLSKLSNQFKEIKKTTRFNSIIQNQSQSNEIYNKTKNKRQLHKINQRIEQDENQSQLLQQFKKGYKKLIRKNKKDSSFKQNNNQKQQQIDIQKQKKLISYEQATTCVNTPINNSTPQLTIDKQSKFQQIINQLNQQEVIMDENYLKMKKYIQRNKLFLKKMELKLHRFDLGVFVIQPTDSLITKKKKIRCLKQIIEVKENQNQLNKGFYDQVMKYLEMYTEHINLVIKKQRNQELQIDFEYRNQEQLQILNSKDYTDSLKFITLQQNQLNQKQCKLQGWILIPQYVTNDKNRLNNFQSFETFMKSAKKMEDIQKLKPVNTQLQQCKDDLIQKSVSNKCTISSYNYYQALADQQDDLKNKNQLQLKKVRLKTSKKLIQKFTNFKL